MPLTNEERFQKERDQVLALIAELVVLRADTAHPDYPRNMQPLLNKLDEHKIRAEFQDNIDAASQALTAVLNDVMETALSELADIVQDMGPLGAELAEARLVAARGERELTLPKIAAVSSTALSSLESLLQSVEALGEADLDDGAKAMKETIAKLKTLIETLPDA